MCQLYLYLTNSESNTVSTFITHDGPLLVRPDENLYIGCTTVRPAPTQVVLFSSPLLQVVVQSRSGEMAQHLPLCLGNHDGAELMNLVRSPKKPKAIDTMRRYVYELSIESFCRYLPASRVNNNNNNNNNT